MQFGTSENQKLGFSEFPENGNSENCICYCVPSFLGGNSENEKKKIRTRNFRKQEKCMSENGNLEKSENIKLLTSKNATENTAETGNLS